MSCAILNNITGWDCSPAGTRAIRAISPLTLGNDGKHAAFYIAQPDEQSFFLTDAGESAMHAAAFGIELSKARINVLNSSHGVGMAKMEDDGSITARGPISDAQGALWDAVKIAMSLSFNSAKWLPKFDQIRFRALVEKMLVEKLGRERVLMSLRARGMSGHEVEFPFAVRAANDRLFYIEPVALSNNKVDWGHIYQVHGKLSDVKQADDENSRLVIFEDGATELEFGRASTLLAQSATIRSLSQMDDWLLLAA